MASSKPPRESDAWVLIATHNSLHSEPSKEEFAYTQSRTLYPWSAVPPVECSIARNLPTPPRPHHPTLSTGPCRRGDRMKRREFIGGLLGIAGIWSTPTRAQQ